MRAPSDCTEVIERFDVFEQRAGVTLNALSALRVRHSDKTWGVTVLGELHAINGAQLEPAEIGSYTYVYATAHDTKGQMIGQGYTLFAHESFFAFAPFEIHLSDLIREPAKLRVYPK